MFGAIFPTTDEVDAVIGAVRAEATRPLATRAIATGDMALEVLFDATTGHEEGCVCSPEGDALAVVSGSIGSGGRMRAGDEAASVLLDLLNCHGELPGHLNGLFAAAVWEADRGRLTLLSDWIGGIKQLFYARWHGGLIFGTDARSLVACGAWERAVDRAALAQYLDFGHSLPPNTLFEGLHKLPAGCELTFGDGEIHVRRRFRLQFSSDGDGAGAPQRVRETHRNAVARCLQSSERVGAFLSGGLDSSLNVAAMRELSDAAIRTFCVTYPGEEIDEGRYARLVADHFDTEHHEIPLESAAVLDELPEMVWALEEPAMDYSFIPTFHLARFARAHVPAVVSGDGPDHLLGRHYPVALIRETLGRLPGARGIAAALVPPDLRPPRAAGLWRSVRRSKGGRFLWKALQSAGGDTLDAYLAIYREMACRSILPRRVRSLLMDPEQLAAVNGQIDPLVAGIAEPQMTEFERVIALDLAIDGSCGVFSKVGRMAGYHGLTVHEPYLDGEFRAVVEALPPHLKATGSVYDVPRGRLRRKVILYEAARGVIPEEILDKPKQGFQAPIGSWLSEWIDGRDARMLLPALTGETQLLDESRINALLREHSEGLRDHGTLIMMLVTLDLWYAIFPLGDARRPHWRWSDRLGAR